MIVGYFLFEILILMVSSGSDTSFAVAATTSLMNVPFNVIQGLAAIILVQVITPILLRIEDVRNIINPV